MQAWRLVEKWKLPDTKDVTWTTAQMLGVWHKWRRMKGSDTSKMKSGEIHFCLRRQFTKSMRGTADAVVWAESAAPCPNSQLPLLWGADSCGGLCADHGVLGFNAYFIWPHSMTVPCYFPLSNSPFRMEFLPVKIWIIVSTFGFNLVKEGGIVKEVQRKQPPVYISHSSTPQGA